ncbi:hypothetical protein [Capnocytophaga genosp. AHN8471]|uniref:hypothetical protein n=1 Tax=Capnocytophaga genosp. AHN8471 TaxID=327574 RepID=UPI0019349597|nr:hypothetical protein [Capnocytophaga genosp. AHN8471]
MNQSKNCVTEKVIKEQFIERDLFNATDISQIKWRIYGQNFTKQDFEKFLRQNKDILEKMQKTIPPQLPTINNTKPKNVDDFIKEITNKKIFDDVFIK